MMKAFYTVVLAAIALTFAACENSDTEVDPKLTITNTEFNFGDYEDLTTVAKFTVNVNWKTEVEYSGASRDWLTLTPASGDAGEDITMTMTAARNETLGERFAYVYIKYGTKKERLTIVQNESIVPELTMVSKSAFTLSKTAGSHVKAKFTVNVGWTAAVNDEAKNWLTITPAEGTSGNDIEMTMTATENPSENTNRQAVVTISYRDEKYEINVTQLFVANLASVMDANIKTALFNKTIIQDVTNITYDEIKDVEELDLRNCNPKLTTLAGLEYFTSLKTLDVANNLLTSFDELSKMPTLEKLVCFNNNTNATEKLDLSNNTALKHLECNNTKLKTLDVSKCTLLEYLVCNSNTNLGNITNGGSGLNLENNTALTYLNCQSMGLSSLDVTKNVALKQLLANANAYASIDLSKNIALDSLVIGNNANLTSLDLSANTALNTLTCSINLPKLTSVKLPSTLTTLTFSSCDALATVEGMASCTSLKTLTIDFCPKIPQVNMAPFTALTSLTIKNATWTALDLSKSTVLTTLDCQNNKSLTSLDVTKCTALTKLVCKGNSVLTALDLSQNTALEGSLDLGSNNLFAIAPASAKITALDLRANQNLSSVNVTKCTGLTALNVMATGITSLDISQNTKITSLTLMNTLGNEQDIFRVKAWFTNANIPPAPANFPATWVHTNSGKTITAEYYQ